MQKLVRVGVWSLALLLTACVTINVYFPEASAQEAAKEFIGNVIGTDPTPPPPPPEASLTAPERKVSFSLLSIFISDAHAQNVDIRIQTPAIQAIQQRMADRFKSTLAAHFDSAAVGFKNDGMIEIRDQAAVPLAQRAALKQAVAEDNRDRAAVYREIAVANGHPEWEADIRETFAQEWIKTARKGWQYQDASGAWQTK